MRREQLENAYTRALKYIGGRQCRSGGFSFYRSGPVEEPTLADTFHAVAALALLGCDAPRGSDILRFLDAFGSVTQPAHLFYVVHTLRLLGRSYVPDSQTLATIGGLHIASLPSPAQISGWLERTRVIVRLQREFAVGPNALPLLDALRRLSSAGGFGSRPNLFDTYLAVDILDACGDARAIRETAAFVDALQIPPFGFTATRVGVNAHVEIVFAGVHACKLLALPIRYRAEALGFVLSCQSRDGGFARAPGTLPNLEATYQALASLVRLTERARGSMRHAQEDR